MTARGLVSCMLLVTKALLRKHADLEVTGIVFDYQIKEFTDLYSFQHKARQLEGGIGGGVYPPLVYHYFIFVVVGIFRVKM